MSRAQLTSTVEQNTGGAVAPFVAGKNAAINGGFDIWQRGTSFTQSTYASPGYAADRWRIVGDATTVVTRESTIVPSGFQYSVKIAGNGSTTPIPFMNQAVETANAIQYAGQTVTLSAYQYASSSLSTKVAFYYSTNVDETQSGSWTAITASSGGTQTATNAWSRNSGVFVVPSTAKSLLIQVVSNAALSAAQSWYVTGVQLEIGSVATPFSRAGGTLSGELEACQRYYWRAGGDAAYQTLATGCIVEGSAVLMGLANPVPMRIAPTSVDYSTLMVYDGNTINTVSTVALNYASRYISRVQGNPTTAPTANRPYWLFTNNSTSAYIGFSAEL